MEDILDSFNKKLDEPLKMNTEIIMKMKEQVLSNINEINLLYDKIERQKEVVGKNRLHYYYDRIKELVLLNKSLKEKEKIINKNFNKRMAKMANEHYKEEKERIIDEISKKKLDKEVCYYYITLIDKYKYTTIFEEIKNKLCCIYEDILLNQIEGLSIDKLKVEKEILESFKCKLLNNTLLKLQNKII